MNMITFLVSSKCRSYRNGSILSFNNCKYTQSQEKIYLNLKELDDNLSPTIVKTNRVEKNKYKTLKHSIILAKKNLIHSNLVYKATCAVGANNPRPQDSNKYGVQKYIYVHRTASTVKEFNKSSYQIQKSCNH